MRRRSSRHVEVPRGRHVLMHVHSTPHCHMPRRLHTYMRTLRLPATRRVRDGVSGTARFLIDHVSVLYVWNQASSAVPATTLGAVLQARIRLVRRGHLPSAVAYMPYVIGVLVQVAVGV